MAVVGLVAAAAVAAPANAGTVTATAAAKPGSPAILHYDLDATAAPINGRLPVGLSVVAPAGIKFNKKAVPKTCNTRAAALGDCSDDSRIGKGSVTVTLTDSSGSRDVTAPVNLFIGQNGSVAAIALVSGAARFAPGTIDLSTGLAFTLVVPQVDLRRTTVTLKRFVMDLGASRNVRVKVVKGKGKKRRVTHKLVHRDLLKLPSTCGPNGAWDSSIRLLYLDGSTVVVPTPVPCG
jgi:hypothetical protein